MLSFKLLMNAGLIIALNVGFAVSAEDCPFNYSSPENLVVPQEYSIMIITNIQNLTFDADVTAIIDIKDKIMNISTYIANLTITDFLLVQYESGLEYGVHKVVQHFDAGLLEIHLDYVIIPGFYYLMLTYHGALYDDVVGIYNPDYVQDDLGNRWFFVTGFETIGGQRWLSCWYEPAVKASFSVTVVYSGSYVALSNMGIEITHTNFHRTDKKRTTFQATPLMSTYLVEIMLTNFDSVAMGNSTIVAWCRSHLVPHVKFALSVAQKVDEVLGRYTNNSRKIPKIDMIGIPGKFQVMQKWGLIVYSEDYFIYNEKLDSVERKIDVAIVVAHGLIHQWVGNVVSSSLCHFMWFNEALSSFFKIYILDKIFIKWRMMDLFVVRYQQLALRSEIDMNMNPIEKQEYDSFTKNNIAPFRHIQSKVPFIMRMVQHIISEHVLRKGVITYLTKYQFNSAAPEDFWFILEDEVRKADIPVISCCTLKEIIESWLTRENYPIVKVTRNYDTDEALICQRNSNQRRDGKPATWWVPITFTTQSSANFSSTLPKSLLKPNQDLWLHNIDKHGWIILNIQQSGFYRVNYDNVNWRKITDYLYSDKYSKIHVLNRAQIIDDAYYFVMEGDLNPIVFLDLMGYLKREIDYIAWYPMKHILPYLWFLSELPPHGSIIKPYTLGIWDELLNNVGYIEDPNDDDLLKAKRMFAIEWACKIGHRKCREEARYELITHVSANTTEMVLSEWKKVIYCAGLITADMNIWMKVLARYVVMNDTEALEYLACSEDEEIILYYLGKLPSIILYTNNATKRTTDNRGAKQNTDHEKAYRHIIKKHAGKDAVLKYILLSFMKLKPRKMPMIEALTVIIENLHQEEQFNKMIELTAENAEIDAALLPEIERLITQRLIQIHKDMEEFKFRFRI